MFKLSVGSPELTNIAVPILHSLPSKKKLFPDYLDVKYFINSRAKLRTLIIKATGVSYTDLISFNEIYYAVFPEKYSIIPAFLIIDKQHNYQILLNKNLATINDENGIIVSNPVYLTTCLLYGLSYMAGWMLDEVIYLKEIYTGFVDYLYGLFLRLYGRKAGIYTMKTNHLIVLYTIIAKGTLSLFFDVSIGIDNIIFEVVNRFASTGSNMAILPTRIKEIIKDVGSVNNWDDIFMKLHNFDIIPDLSLQQFKIDVANLCTMLFISLSGGLPLLSILSAAHVSNSFIPSIVMTVNSRAVHIVTNSLNKFVEGVINGNV